MKVSGRRLICSGVGLTLALVIWLADPLLLTILVFAALFYAALPLTGVGVVFFLYARAIHASPSFALRFLVTILIGSALLGVSVPLNRLVQAQAEALAKDYPARVAPALEAYRQTSGAYPSSLDQLPSKPFVPRLLRRPFGYRSDGKHYSFSFPVPGGMIDVWDYSSQTKNWSVSD